MSQTWLVLDIDGVLNCGDDHALYSSLVVEQGLTYQEIHDDTQVPLRFIRRGDYVNVEKVKLLRDWIAKHNVRVVGVSSWFSTLEMDTVGNFLGIDIEQLLPHTCGGEWRAAGLSEWVAQTMPERLVVLDDQWDWYDRYGFADHHVKPVNGLCESDIELMNTYIQLPVNHHRISCHSQAQSYRRRAIGSDKH